MQVGLGADALFVDLVAAPRNGRGAGSRAVSMRLVAGDQMGVAVAGGGRGLEAAIAPAGIQVEIVDMGCGR